ncbi:C6 finger domain-containing protein [Phlyctema vagabunda]|uniref:C6 finger domain-containing protein n=1 Tax=Phlyctema vagabunda TaxID=108571 RepID=A0ABR4PN21_9HELO
MQALSIYILIRLEEGQTDHNNFDFLLLTTVTVIGKQLNRRLACKEQSALYNYGIGTSWKDWLYEESRRRLVVVYRVVDMLVYFEPAAICELQKDLVLAPLPAKKQLWEAADGLAWKAASEREFGVQADFGLAANGELVKFDIDQPYCSNSVLLYRTLDARSQAKSAENWEEWCSGMDGLGGLVMLAASLTG